MLLCLEFQLSSNLVNLSHNAGRGTELMDGGVIWETAQWQTPMACWPIYNLNQLSFIRIDVQPTGAQPFGSLPNFSSYPFRNITQLKLTWLKLWNLVEIVKFGRNFEIWWKLWNLVGIVEFGENCKICWKLWN